MKTRRFPLIATFLLAFALCLLAGWWLLRPSPQQRAAQLFEQAYEDLTAGRFEAAEQAATRAYQLDPARDDARLIAAQSASRRDDFSASLLHAEAVSPTDPSLYGAAQLLAAQITHNSLYRLSAAVEHYRSVLAIDPENVVANSGLARLYGETGQRSAAIEPVLKLIRSGNAGDLLMLLAREDGVIDNQELLNKAQQANDQDPLPLIGLAWHAADKGQHQRAAELLQRAITHGKQEASGAENAQGRPIAEAQLGLQWAALGDFEALARWSLNLNPAAETEAASWIARGRLAEHLGQSRAAIRCYLEAAQRQPESKIPNARLAQLLAGDDQTQLATAFATHARQLQALTDLQDRIFFSSEPSGLDRLLELVDQYQEVGRNWEAFGWLQLATQIDATAPAVRERLGRLQQQLRGTPLQVTDPRLAPVRLCDKQEYPLPDVQSPTATPEGFAKPKGSGPLPVAKPGTMKPGTMKPDTIDFQFADVTAQVELNFTYFNGSAEQPPRRMYAFTGGGIAVLDYDLDGWPDSFFTQGTTWPAAAADGRQVDMLYRNQQGERFQHVAAAFSEQELGFGQGVTVGDYDADGFPDIYVANAGSSNRLYRNNGDGTFQDVTLSAGLSGQQWTTSTVMADLNGDGLADIYDVNYVRGEDVFQRVCVDANGHPAICMPFDFDSERDTLWINQGNGTFLDRTAQLLQPQPLGKGLGVVTADVAGDGNLSLIVANDTTPNFLYNRMSREAKQWSDRATVAGIAFNEDGKAEGCMGIAAWDLNQDGLVDCFITNFLYESNSLYISQGPNLFADKTRALGLHNPSLNVLGFGAQFLDLNLDGQAELFVANGHIDDLSRNNRPYTMPAQLFTQQPGGFREVIAKNSGDYFQQQWLGRAVARLDWNRDGREDLLVGHLYDSSRLLENQTTAVGNYVAIKLVGTTSSRDAIGARVKVSGNGIERFGQLTSGDGYQARNEAQLVFGLGELTSVEQLEISWPSGRRESFPVDAINQTLTCVEGRGRELDSPRP
ncbi:FG-GAP-like repeat-containing protein [Planctomycetaceae bacterium SH139]